MKYIYYYERGTKYKVYEDGTMYHDDSKLTHRKMEKAKFDKLYSKYCESTIKFHHRNVNNGSMHLP